MTIPAPGAEQDRHEDRGLNAEEDDLTLLQPFKRKPKRCKKDGTPYKPRQGWGPYRSVPNERAVAFNLQLDVQNLQQEVYNLTALRDILQTKTKLRRDSPEDSLSRLVNEFFQVFRKGRVLSDPNQTAFMYRIMDEEVEVGNGLCGPDVILDQMTRYSTFFRFICMDGHVNNIVIADDSVLISTEFSVKFQVLRNTIDMMFPHILDNEWLISRLVGQKVDARGRTMLHFNAAGKCFKYDVDVDLVEAFTSVVKDPQSVDFLLNQTRIADGAMVGVIHGDKVGKDENASVTCNAFDSMGVVSTCAAPITSSSAYSNAHEFCQQVAVGVVENYFSVFANGYDDQTATNLKNYTRAFFQTSISQTGVETAANYVRRRWYALSKCFEVLNFEKCGKVQAERDPGLNMCLTQSSATYILRLTSYTIQSLFPHLVSNLLLYNHLVGKVIEVPSQIVFSMEKTTGRIFRIDESMDFATGLVELLPDRQDLSFVLSQALLVCDGVGSSRPEFLSSFAASRYPTQDWDQKRRYDDLHSSPQAMSMDNILNR